MGLFQIYSGKIQVLSCIVETQVPDLKLELVMDGSDCSGRRSCADEWEIWGEINVSSPQCEVFYHRFVELTLGSLESALKSSLWMRAEDRSLDFKAWITRSRYPRFFSIRSSGGTTEPLIYSFMR